MAESLSGSKESLVVKSDDENFKKPLNRAPSKKRKVLDEETYLKKLGEIIERDFFPDIAEIANELQEDAKLQTSRLGTSESTRSGLSLEPQSSRSPASFETPIVGEAFQQSLPHNSPAVSNLSLTHKRNIDTANMTIDEFMSSYTSEDNESFEKLLQEQLKMLKLKYRWLYKAELKHRQDHMPNLALPSPDDQRQMKMLAFTGKTNKKDDTRPLSLENWDYETFNSVMFVPEGAPVSKTDAIAKAHTKKKEICHQNTRFTENPFHDNSNMNLESHAFQNNLKDGKIGVDGREIGASPHVNGYKFMRSPSPAPGVDCSPLMTWGQVEGTPLWLEGSQTPLLRDKQPFRTAYKMPKASRKDELLKKISEKLSKNHRPHKSPLRSPSVGSSKSSMFDQKCSMSPAAQRLLSKKIVKKKGFSNSLSASYTPSPLNITSTPSFARTPTPSKRLHTGPSPISKSTVSTPDLTDNLLNLPSKQSAPISGNLKVKRKFAADFF